MTLQSALKSASVPKTLLQTHALTGMGYCPIRSAGLWQRRRTRACEHTRTHTRTYTGKRARKRVKNQLKRRVSQLRRQRREANPRSSAAGVRKGNMVPLLRLLLPLYVPLCEYVAPPGYATRKRACGMVPASCTCVDTPLEVITPV